MRQVCEHGYSGFTAANMERIVELLEKMGVIFIPENGEGPGIRLRKSKKK